MTQQPFQLQHETHLNSPVWEKLNDELIVGFTTKNGGISSGDFHSLNLGLHVNDKPEHVVLNRKRLAEELNMPLENWVCADQIHDSSIQKVTQSDRGKGILDYHSAIPGTDGLYTREENLMLALCYADCVPLYFYEHNKKLIGTAHAGWKGTVKDIGGKMIQTWIKDEEADVNLICAIIGPSIGACCYVVDDYVIDRVNQVIRNTDPLPYQKVSEGQYSLDLKQLNKQLLINAGVKEDRILTSSFCTSCESSMFFSHRKDAGSTGRMFSFIGLTRRHKQL
ncbi:peptidoglycan editing factor PgeF [Bacillus idriensis]|uniref:Purine nucleoside phosphorylase n=1 Tax=Metabacillus idriensis TaxID=324768 RepID=A0A6I2M6R8_9BACI|nr:peptidoglycan editing factor PgeF [Metabacillus idriensis]MRX53579.1 peptidoglycan editing factor PgeF [Metabacillus idriensis]